jgi:hypothetical protein
VLKEFNRHSHSAGTRRPVSFFAGVMKRAAILLDRHGGDHLISGWGSG